MRARSSTRRAAVALVAVIAGAVLSGSAAASGELNAKHFFWAQGQSPDGTRRLGDATTSSTTAAAPAPARSASRRRPAVYLDLLGPEWADGLHDGGHGREALLEQDAADLPEHVHGEPGRQPVGGRADAVLPQRARGHDELRRHRQAPTSSRTRSTS